MPTRQETIVSSVNWAVFCKPLCAESQRKGIQRRLSEATEEEGMTVVEQDRVRTLIRLSKARKYDATKEFLQRMLAQFPGTGGQGPWSLHSVSVEVRRDAQSSATAAPTLHLPASRRRRWP